MNTQDTVKSILEGEELIVTPALFSNIQMLVIIIILAAIGAFLSVDTSVSNHVADLVGGLVSGTSSVTMDPHKVINIVIMFSMLSCAAIVYIQIHSFTYIITKDNVTSEIGFFAKDTVRAPINQGVLPETSQDILGRLLSYGDIKITLNTNTAATDTAIFFKNVDDPAALADIIVKVAEATDRTRGMYQSRPTPVTSE